MSENKGGSVDGSGSVRLEREVKRMDRIKLALEIWKTEHCNVQSALDTADEFFSVGDKIRVRDEWRFRFLWKGRTFEVRGLEESIDALVEWTKPLMPEPIPKPEWHERA